MWLKYRHKWASGFGDWEWRHIGTSDPEAVREAHSNLASKWQYEDRYHGIESELVESPPDDVLEREAEDARSKAEHWSRWARQLGLELAKRRAGA